MRTHNKPHALNPATTSALHAEDHWRGVSDAERSMKTVVDASVSTSIRAFTLIELLVTLAVIAILAGLLVSTISRSRARAGVVSCQMLLRQVWLATLVYADDNRGFMPTYYFFYGQEKMNPRCPGIWPGISSDHPLSKSGGYSWGWPFMDGEKIDSIDSRTYVACDYQPWHDPARTWEEDNRGIEYWTGKHNFLRADGHIGVQEIWMPRMDR